MALKYEFHQDASLPGLEKLWVEATDWGKTAFDNMRPWLDAAPFGKPHIMIATDTDTGEIVGQFRFMPSLVTIDGKEIRAVRPFATIVSPAMHNGINIKNPLDLPVVAMYSRAVEELKAIGVQLIYMVPDPLWARVFKIFPFLQTETFPLWSLPVPFEKPMDLDKAYTAVPLKEWDERVDRLWKKSSHLHGCMMKRDAATLRWKLAIFNYTTIVIEKDGELVGFVTSRQKGDKQWLVCDMLCADADDAMRATIIAVSNVAHEESLIRSGEDEIKKVAVLATPAIEPIVRELGFVRDAFDFLIAVQVLDPNISAEAANPARWYVSAND